MQKIDGLTRRCWVHLGYSCNSACLFCYFRDSLKLKDKPINKIKKILKKLKNKKIENIELIGGEPTIRTDIFEILSFAKKLEFNDVCVITNGSKTYDFNFCKELIKQGATSFLFSIEAENAELHDYLTQRKGSFQKIVMSMKNVNKLKVPFQTNTTITKFNYKNLPDLANFLLRYKPRLVNFLIYWPFDDGKKYYNHMAPRYSAIEPYITKAIKILEDKVKDVNLRYFPFCAVKRYRKYICGYPQKIYDKEQWNNLVMDQIKYGSIVNLYHILRGVLNFKDKSRMLHLPFRNLLGEAMVSFIISKHFIHLKKCRSCKYYFICNGVWKPYIKLYGKREIEPVSGQKISDPLFFRRTNKYENISDNTHL